MEQTLDQWAENRLRVTVYHCPTGMMQGTLEPPHDFIEVQGGVQCAECGTLCDEAGQTQSAGLWVVPYDISRKYGGPEEGGWWYDTGTAILEEARYFSACHMREAHAYYNKMQKVYETRTNTGKIPQTSFPAYHPHYE